MVFYTENDLKEMLHISVKKAKALMRVDGFPSIKIGNTYRVEQELFIQWMKNNKYIKLDYSKCWGGIYV